MNCHAFSGWLLGLLLVARVALSQQLAGAPPHPAPDSVDLKLAELVQRLTAVDSLTARFDDKLEVALRADKPTPAFELVLDTLLRASGQYQDQLNDFEESCTDSSQQLIRLPLRSYINALRSYRGVARAVIDLPHHAFRDKDIQQRIDDVRLVLMNCAVACLQAVQQVRSERHLQAQLALFAGQLRRQDQYLTDLLACCPAASDLDHSPTATAPTTTAPRLAVLASTYLVHAYALGGVYWSASGWLAAVAGRYDVSAGRWGGELAFGYRAQSFGLLAGPTLQVAPRQLGWKIQALLLKPGPTLGATYDSRLGPGVLAAFFF